MPITREELADRLAKADRELTLLRRATRELREAGRIALQRRNENHESRRSDRDGSEGGSPPGTS